MINTDDLPAARAHAARVAPSHGRQPTRSFYLTMRDGVRVAVDVHLPVGADRAPTIIRQTRYFRGVHPRRWVAPLLGDATFDPMNARMRDFFVRRGYAWVDVDVRGSGASSGSWLSPWSPLEVLDGAEVLSWIVAQPWSNGRVGATGNSYDGTAADFLATNAHPALRAIAPRCSLFDVYTDIAYPGGIHQNWFTRAWTRANMALDANRPQGMIAEAIGQGFPRLAEGRPRRALERVLATLVDGVRAVDGDGEGLRRALRDHAENMDVDEVANGVAFRDDVRDSPLGPRTIDVFSPSTYADRIRATDVAVLGISGWFDAAYPHAAIKRHLTLGRATDKLLIGPWNHGCTQHASPAAADRRASFLLDGELLRFFDRHLRDGDTGIDDEPAVRFFTMGEERWRSADAWPPPGATPVRLHLAKGGRLARARGDGETEVPVDRAARTGKRSRWRTLVSPLVVPDYRGREASTVFESDPLEHDLEVTGHALAVLSLRSDASDGAVFVYLSERRRDGTERYVTEGQLRLVHAAVHDDAPRAYRSPAPHRPFTRESARPFPEGRAAPVAIDLLPVSYRFARGSRVALAVAGGDADHFAPVDGARRYVVDHADSYLELPAFQR